MAIVKLRSSEVGNDSMRHRPCPDCATCRAPGEFIYKGLQDHLFAAPGRWDLKRCTNASCGLLWLDPMPLPEDLGKAYTEYYTHVSGKSSEESRMQRFAKAVRASFLDRQFGYRCTIPFKGLLSNLLLLHPARKATAEFSVFYLDPLANGRLLEVGCGSGEMLKEMQSLGWEVEGIDFDPGAVRNAREKGLVVHEGTLESVDLPSESFDAVVLSHVIEHVPDPELLIAQCKRLLKPAGKLVLITPNTKSWAHRLYQRNWRGLEPPRHLHLFNSGPLRSMLAAAHFNAVEVFTTIRDANTVFVASRSISIKRSFNMMSKRPVLLRFWAFGMQMFESSLLLFDRDAGEELVAIARK